MNLTELAGELKSKRLTFSRLANATGVLLDVRGMSVYTLNESGLVIMEALAEGICDEKLLTERMVARFEVDGEKARQDVAVFIAELQERLK